MANALAAGVVVALYGALCFFTYARHRQKKGDAAKEAAALLPGGDVQPLLVLHASQTGQAEELAWQTARVLHAAGVPVRLAALSAIARADLRGAQRALVIASTYGEGDPPDSAATFARDVMGGADAHDLVDVHYGVLALGDRTYRNFGGFGRALDEWMRRQGAQPMFERIDVDNGDARALAQWRRHLGRLAGTADLPDWEAPAFGRWRIAERRLLNPGSRGEPAFHVELAPEAGLPAWESGDLAQLRVPSDPDRPREYSIASLPGDGRVHLLVRRTLRSDGTVGAASGLLADSALGNAVELRVRPHRGFRLEGNAARPLVLIGNGTGMAGLRGHLKARALSGPKDLRTWLVFGERESARDAFYRDEVEAWRADGTLSRADWAFSRDPADRRYVQHVLREEAQRLRRWVEEGAALYVCGSLEGMASGVHHALGDILGAPLLERLAAEGRYRRDVY